MIDHRHKSKQNYLINHRSVIGRSQNKVKRLERDTSNEFDQFKNKVALEKLQREIEQVTVSQESDLLN